MNATERGAAPVLKQFSGGKKTQARLTHEEVAERFVDYHFGRLTPALNRAVEDHVRSCDRCRREGLTRAAAERQAANRKLRRVRGGKPLIGPRGRLAMLALLVLISGQVVLFQIAQGRARPLLSVFTQNAPATGGDPIALAPYTHLPSGASDASAIALSVDGKSLAVSQGGAHPNVSVWSTRTGDRVATFPWGAPDAPATLAWSPDGSMVAASSPSTLMIWTVTPVLVIAKIPLPVTPALLTYDLGQKAVSVGDDASHAFSAGPLAWEANGALGPAPAGAVGPTGVTTPQTPVIGFWSSEGAHLFSEGAGPAHVGVSSAEAQSGVALLDWSPDGRYLLWSQADLPVSGDGSSSASALPDAVTQELATRVAAAKGAATPGEGDALLWFSPDASQVAVCDRTRPNALMAIYTIASGAVAATLTISCASLPAHAAQWSADGSQFFVAPTNGSVQIYNLPHS